MDVLPTDASIWQRLKRATPARIGLDRIGVGLATRDHLAFQRDHARARDAVHAVLDPTPLLGGLRERGLTSLLLQSAARDRQEFLARPDRGRRLAEGELDLLAPLPRGHDLIFVLGDGLSARALGLHALPLLDATLPSLRDWRIGPVAVVRQARVAIGDEIGEVLGAALVAVLIGERPGLSSPASLGVYLTWEPKLGRRDAERNCISNVAVGGLAYEKAAHSLIYLLNAARRLRLTGVALKDDSAALALSHGSLSAP